MKMFLLLDPPRTTAQMQKVAVVHGKPRFYKPDSVLKAKGELITFLKPFRLKEPLKGPVELRVTWYFPKDSKHKHGEWKITKPDTDNLEKLLKDCMTELGFWNDDAQVVSEHVEKVWSKEPTGISIEINELPKIRKEDSDG